MPIVQYFFIYLFPISGTVPCLLFYFGMLQRDISIHKKYENVIILCLAMIFFQITNNDKWQ